MGKTDVGPTAVADCGPMKMPMEARHRADEFCQLGAKRRRKCTRQSRSCLQLGQIFTDLKKITNRLSNKPFIIWLLTTPPHLQFVATLPCNLSLMACFADINASQITR